MENFINFLVEAEIIDYLVKGVFLVLSGLVAIYVIPWLKEKKLYNIVKQFVQAAEKYGQTHDINKHEYVINLLKERGIEISPVVEALIESAVEELDIALKKVNGDGT